MNERYSRMITATGALGAALVLLRLPPHPALLAHELARPRGWVAEVGPDAAVASLAATLLWLASLWLVLALLVSAVALLPGRTGGLASRIAARLVPAALGRLVAAAAGASMLMTPIAAHADPGAASPRTAVSATAKAAAASSSSTVGATTNPGAATAAPALPTLGWPTDPVLGIVGPSATALPPVSSSPGAVRKGPADRSPTQSPTTPITFGPTGAHGARNAAPVTVKPGDSLWLITAQRLGGHASEGQIAVEWPHWYSVNRDRIGRDPNLLRPGTELQSPSASASDSGSRR